MFDKIKSFFIRRKFRFATRAAGVKHAFVDIERARRAGIIVNANESKADDLRAVKEYSARLEKSGVKTLLVELNFDKKSAPAFENIASQHLFINPVRLTWLEMPDTATEALFRQEELDVLINLDSSGRPASHYLSGISHAKTRVGLHSAPYEACYELMTVIPADKGAREKLSQFDHFLKMLEK